MSIPLIVDTDISLGTPNAEIDDGAALILLAKAPKIAIKAVTTVHGNVPVEIASTNMIRLRNLLNLSDVPIAQGAGQPRLTDPTWKAFLDEWQSQYGPTPPTEGDLESNQASDLIIETIKRYPDEIILLALGPLTNLALCLNRKPEIAKMVRAVYAMGGSWDSGDTPEFNIRCDPEAAQAVFQADWPVYLHGLDVTRQALFTLQDFADLDRGKPAQRLLQNQAKDWIGVVEAQKWEEGGCSLHDAAAAAGIVAPDLFEYTSAQIEILSEDGPQRGVTRILAKNQISNIQIANNINADACRALMLKLIKE